MTSYLMSPCQNNVRRRNCGKLTHQSSSRDAKPLSLNAGFFHPYGKWESSPVCPRHNVPHLFGLRRTAVWRASILELLRRLHHDHGSHNYKTRLCIKLQALGHRPKENVRGSSRLRGRSLFLWRANILKVVVHPDRVRTNRARGVSHLETIQVLVPLHSSDG